MLDSPFNAFCEILSAEGARSVSECSDKLTFDPIPLRRLLLLELIGGLP